LKAYNSVLMAVLFALLISSRKKNCCNKNYSSKLTLLPQAEAKRSKNI